MNKANFIEDELFEKFDSVIPPLRVIICIVVLLFVYITDMISGFHPLFVYAVLFYTLFSLLSLAWSKPRRYINRNCHYGASLFSLVFFCLIIGTTGGSESPFSIVYTFLIIIYAVRFGLKTTLIITTMIVISYGVTLFITDGYISHLFFLDLILYYSIATVSGMLFESAQKHTYSLAVQDGLTALYNHKFFYDKLSSIIKYNEKINGVFSLALLDVDDFKKYNDKMGHLEGDEMLKTISYIISQNIRSIDTAARYGGDEFAIIFPNTTHETAISICDRIREAIEEKFNEQFHKDPHDLSISIGIASYPHHGITATELFKSADRALYLAKETGKNTIVCQQSLFELSNP